MKRLCVLLLAACGALSAYEHWVRFKTGASRVYRGYSSWVMIHHEWHDKEVSFTANPATDVVTAPGHSFTTDTLIWVRSSGTLPGGLTNKRQYRTCDISGDTFKLVAYGTTCSSDRRADITDTGTGTHRAGIGLDNGPPPHPQWPVYLETLTGVPSGVTYEVWCEESLCGAVTTPVTGWRSINGNQYFLIRFTASGTAQLGQHTITARLHAYMPGGGSEPVETIQLPLTVAELAPIPSARPASYPPVAGLATFNSSVYPLSRRWCDPASYETAAAWIAKWSPNGYGLESNVWYYDGTWVYRQVARYLNQPEWNNCADYINEWYRNYTLQLDGAHAGYKAFTAGLKSSCAPCDMRNRLGIVRMAARQSGYRTCGWPWDWWIRETAYYLETLVSYEQVTGTRHPKLQRTAENLLAMFDELFRDNTYTYQQTYWNGLAMRALIQYFDLTGDQRVPVEIKNALDWMWANCWNDSTKKYVYNPDPVGPRCDYGCRDQAYGWEWSELIGLVVPAAGWYYWFSGDDLYRQRGDEWFKALPRWPMFSADATTKRITITDHGLSVNDRVNPQPLIRGTSLPSGCLAGNAYYWVNNVIDANTFTVSTTKGGSTLNITTSCTGYMGLKCPTYISQYGKEVTECPGHYSGKMFSQMMRWAIAYVQWRQGQTPYAP